MGNSISEEFMLEDDMAIVEEWAGKLHAVGISFRPAGKETLKCLKRGAGAKPHAILDKTLKDKTGTSASAIKHNAAVQAFFSDFTGASLVTATDLLKGLVGHWTGGQVDGLYVTSIGYKILKEKTGFTLIDKDIKKPYLLLKTDTEKEKLLSYFNDLLKDPVNAPKDSKKENKAYYLFTRLFFSGDYDIHDFLKDKYQVPTLLDEKHLNILQKALKAGRKSQLIESFGLKREDFSGEMDEDYQRVQHGPQYNYTAQMLNENYKSQDSEKFNFLVESVMDMDPPVAVYDNDVLQGKWVILSDDAAVSQYYEKYGLNVKSTWTSPEGRESFIVNNIVHIIRLCYPSAEERRKVTPEKLLERVPALKEIYGGEAAKYAQAALNKLAGN